MSGKEPEKPDSPSEALREAGGRIKEALSRAKRMIELKYRDLPSWAVFVLGVIAALFFENLAISIFETLVDFITGFDPTSISFELGQPPELPVSQRWTIWFLLFVAFFNSIDMITQYTLQMRIKTLEERVDDLEKND